jgi:hypothetical protein
MIQTSNTSRASSPYRWKFFRAGGFDQVRLDAGADLLALPGLDPKLWVALACPTRGIEFDTTTLDLIDTDKDGRIRVPEILAAVQWAGAHLKTADTLLEGSSSLALSAIDESTAEGRRILASAKQILAGLGKPDAKVLTVEDTGDTVRIFAQTSFNGDGIVPADAAEDPATRKTIEDVLACEGSVADRSGKAGVDRKLVDLFFAEARAFSDWSKRAETEREILPLDARTATAVAAVQAVRAKVDDYFARTRLAAFDGRALAALNRSESEYLAIAAQDMTITAAEISGFPLARIEAGKPLPLLAGVNPAWAPALQLFHAEAVKPLIGDKSTISEGEWQAVNARLAPFERWAAAKSGASVEKLGLPRVREILASKAEKAIGDLLARDAALEAEANGIVDVDRLVRYVRDLHKLIVNFVNFRDFYTRRDKAVFQVGTLYLDQRSCELAVRVTDPAKHAAMAALSGTYLAYCDCVRKGSGETMTIAAAFTNGDSDNLMVGRNGIFIDRKGRDWDATIVKIVDNPISIRQAFWSPYKKVIRLIQQQIQKMAAAREKKVDDAAAAKVDQGGTAVDAGKTPEKKEPFDVAKMVGIFAAIGLAMGGIGALLGALLTAFMKLAVWQMPIALFGLMLLVSGPSMIIAALKLRQRNLGPILDANGWAVNAKARVNIPFGRSLTGIAVLPPGSQRDLVDPYAEKKSGRNWMIAGFLFVVAVTCLWFFGVLERVAPWLPDSSFVARQKAEAAAQAAPAAPAAAAPAEAPK